MKNSIKILMCGNHKSNKGGMTTVISQILDHDWSEDNIIIKFIPTYYSGKKFLTICYFIYAYIRVLFSYLLFKPNVFYTHMSVRGSFTRTKALHRLSKYFNVPDIVHLHGSEFKDWYNSESASKQEDIKALIEECSSFIVLGKKWKEFVTAIAPKAKVIQVHNCIKIPDATIEQNSRFQFLYLGVLIQRKGVIDLLEAINNLYNQNKIDNCTFAIGGTGPEEETLKKYVEDNKLANIVRFHGWVTGLQKETLLQESSALILPSYNEGLPVSILEAMSYGLPIISTRVGDIEDAVDDTVNGYLFEPGDVNALANAICNVKDPEKWMQLSTASRKKAETEFNIVQFYAELKKAWIGVIE